jgi:hypothetical protein
MIQRGAVFAHALPPVSVMPSAPLPPRLREPSHAATIPANGDRQSVNLFEKIGVTQIVAGFDFISLF